MNLATSAFGQTLADFTNACRGFPTELTPRGQPCCFVKILWECTYVVNLWRGTISLAGKRMVTFLTLHLQKRGVHITLHDTNHLVSQNLIPLPKWLAKNFLKIIKCHFKDLSYSQDKHFKFKVASIFSLSNGYTVPLNFYIGHLLLIALKIISSHANLTKHYIS